MNQEKAWVHTFACDLMQNAWLQYKGHLQLSLSLLTIPAANIEEGVSLKEGLIDVTLQVGKMKLKT